MKARVSLRFAVALIALLLVPIFAKIFKLALTLPLLLLGVSLILISQSTYLRLPFGGKTKFLKILSFNAGAFAVLFSVAFSFLNLLASKKSSNRDTSFTQTYGSYSTANSSFWIRDNQLGYRYKPHSYKISARKVVIFPKRVSNNFSLYDVTYNINEHGNRSSFYDTADSVNTVAFAGGSFMFGEGLMDDQTLPSLYSQISGSSSINLGMHGYGTHQVLRVVEHESTYSARVPSQELKYFVYRFHPEHIKRSAGYASWDPDGPCYEINKTTNQVEYLGTFRTCKAADLLDPLIVRLAQSSEPLTKKYANMYLEKDFYSENYKLEDIRRAALMIQSIARQVNKKSTGKLVLLIEDYYFSAKHPDQCLVTSSPIDSLLQYVQSPDLMVFRVSEIILPADCRPSDIVLSPEYDTHPSAYLNSVIARFLSEKLKL